MKQFGPNCFISGGKTSGNADLLLVRFQLTARSRRVSRYAFHDHETLIYLKENSMKKIIALSALMAALASANAMAADANLTFTGSVTSSTCTMNSSDATKTLTIPDISAAALAGSTTAWQYQTASASIGFTSCPANISTVSVSQITSTGARGSNAVNTIPASGTATGLVMGIALGTNPNWMPADGSILSANNSFSVTNGSVSIPVKAAISPSGTPTAGNYSNSYTLTFSWS